MIITNLLFKTHNCRKIRSPTKIWGQVSAHVILAFLSDGHLLTFSTLKVPTTAIRSSITTQLFLFLSISAQLSQFAAPGLSLSLSFFLLLRPVFCVRAARPSRVPLAVRLFFVPFCTRFY